MCPAPSQACPTPLLAVHKPPLLSSLPTAMSSTSCLNQTTPLQISNWLNSPFANSLIRKTSRPTSKEPTFYKPLIPYQRAPKLTIVWLQSTVSTSRISIQITHVNFILFRCIPAYHSTSCLPTALSRLWLLARLHALSCLDFCLQEQCTVQSGWNYWSTANGGHLTGS